MDAFQHWIYTHPGHTRAERTSAWLRLYGSFRRRRGLDGYEAARGNLWHRQLHIFIHPFYYVEYGIAQLGALQVWANSKRDRANTLREYQRGLALGGSRTLPELIRGGGLPVRFQRTDFAAFGPIGRRRTGKTAVMAAGWQGEPPTKQLFILGRAGPLGQPERARVDHQPPKPLRFVGRL